MNELLFFVLGYIIGGLSGITLISFLVVSKRYDNKQENIEVYNNEECEKEI